MTKTSSTDAAAITIVGIPFATPRRSCMKRIMAGTTTAGETAASTAPSSADSR
jgi:hypothetical protein